ARHRVYTVVLDRARGGYVGRRFSLRSRGLRRARLDRLRTPGRQGGAHETGCHRATRVRGRLPGDGVWLDRAVRCSTADRWRTGVPDSSVLGKAFPTAGAAAVRARVPVE